MTHHFSLKPAHSILVIAGIYILLLYIPMWLKLELTSTNKSILGHSINSPEFRGSSTALMISCCPTLLDLFLDSFTFSSSSIEEKHDYLG
jgi:hypothetical protein